MHEVHSDLIVVGAGPAGVAAAVEAAERGMSVSLVDDNGRPGGQIWRQGAAPAPPPAARRWIQKLRATGVAHELGTTVVDASGPTRLFAVQGGATVCYRSRATVLATGSRERFLPFPGWTTPGVYGAGGLQALVKGGWPIQGQRVVVAGSGPLLLAVTDYLLKAGATVVALVEQTSRRRLLTAVPATVMRPRKAWQALGYARRLRGVRQIFESWPVGAEGKDGLEALLVRTPRGMERIECDAVACGFGLVPDLVLPTLLGCALDGDRVRVDEYQTTSVDNLYCAGETTGVGGVDVALLEGRIAGCAAAGATAEIALLSRRLRRERRFARAIENAFELRPELAELPTGSTVVCRCEDVTYGALRGYSDVRDAKLQTRCGMGPCQARICGPAMRFLQGWGPDTVRPPLFPISTAALAEIGAAQTRGRES